MTSDTIGYITIKDDELHWKGNKIQAVQKHEVALHRSVKIIAFLATIAGLLASSAAFNEEFCIIEVGQSCRGQQSSVEHVLTQAGAVLGHANGGEVVFSFPQEMMSSWHYISTGQLVPESLRETVKPLNP